MTGVLPSGPGCQPTASAASRLRKVASLTRDYFGQAFHRLAPFLLCCLGGAVFAFMGKEGWHWFLALVGGVLWTWAIDLASVRADAKATTKAAARFMAMVMEDHDCEITVTNKHIYYADDATREAIRAASGTEAGTAETGTGSFHDGPVGTAETPDE